jgi:hypothetical protein
MSPRPIVSVVIATYNWSSVLRFAIASVLAQSFRDFELLVVGDCCTDDSETVVRSFNDNRVSWRNLKENCGNQFGPNNQGLALASGRYIAYLGHDDLWHPDHLTVLVRAIEAHEADLVFALTEEIGPPEAPTRSLLGLCASGAYEWSIWAPPSSWLHRHDLITQIGMWRDYKSIVMPSDVDFLDRVYNHGCRIVPVNELTVFKFTSVMRTNAYVERRCDEQAQWWERLRQDPDLRYRELIDVLMSLGRQHPDTSLRFHLPSRVAPGSLVSSFRARRGLAPASDRPVMDTAMPPLFVDRSTLRYLNAKDDIGPARDRAKIHNTSDLPSDGLFVGLNWHSLESDVDGTRWRWIDGEAQIVVTRPSGLRRQIVLDLIPGPGIRKLPCRLEVRDASGAVVAELSVSGGGLVAINLPVVAGIGAIFMLGTQDGGRPTRGDPRILNFRVFSFRWGDDETNIA